MAGIGTAGFGPGSTFRFSGRPGSTESNTFRYPSAWWDVAHMDLPRSVKHLFKWCRYHMLVNPLVSSVTRKMAAYPITEFIIEQESKEGFDKHQKRWEDLLFRVLKIDQFQLEVGLDYQGYGNAIVSILLPFQKCLTCKNCKYTQRIKKLEYKKQWDFKDFKYILTCPRCGVQNEAKVEDVSYKSYRDIKLIRWNPSDIDIDFNPITRHCEYAYSIPEKVRTKIQRKNRRYLEEMPQIIIQALKEMRPVVLNNDNVFHFKAPTPSLEANDEGWGYPPILPALKDSFYLQVMKKAQEQILLEHMVPLDIMFPASSDANANPYMMINLADWKQRVETELVRWRWDPNYKPILPVPIGHQRIGGNGRALLLTQEIRAWSEHIIAGMGVPQEFAFGGLTWSGSSVSLRMLENQFMTYRAMHENFVQNWLIPRISSFMGWSEISLHMREFKMADDMQMKQLLMNLNQMKKISDKTLLSEFGRDALEENRIIEDEMRRSLSIQRLQSLYSTEIQNENQAASFKAQQKLQKQQMAAQVAMQQQMAAQGMVPPGMAPPGMAPPGAGPQPPPQQGSGINVIELAEAYAKKLAGMDPAAAAGVLQRMSEQSPQLHALVAQRVEAARTAEMKPLPEQRPPRREGALI